MSNSTRGKSKKILKKNSNNIILILIIIAAVFIIVVVNSGQKDVETVIDVVDDSVDDVLIPEVDVVDPIVNEFEFDEEFCVGFLRGHLLFDEKNLIDKASSPYLRKYDIPDSDGEIIVKYEQDKTTVISCELVTSDVLNFNFDDTVEYNCGKETGILLDVRDNQYYSRIALKYIISGKDKNYMIYINPDEDIKSKVKNERLNFPSCEEV
tara:strand:- start:584 stop:1210 length:627 start_codon:yes stop_codon:yes gene_type:complete